MAICYSPPTVSPSGPERSWRLPLPQHPRFLHLPVISGSAEIQTPEGQQGSGGTDFHDPLTWDDPERQIFMCTSSQSRLMATSLGPVWEDIWLSLDYLSPSLLINAVGMNRCRETDSRLPASRTPAPLGVIIQEDDGQQSSSQVQLCLFRLSSQRPLGAPSACRIKTKPSGLALKALSNVAPKKQAV